MIPKPEHLGPRYAAHFKDQSIIDVYHFRPPHSPEVFETLFGLITEEPRNVLDAGCGTGDIGRSLVSLVDRVDSVDFSPGMIEKGKKLPGGDHPNLHWIQGPMEEVSLHPPYALITAGDSLHWMAWDIVLPRFKEALTSNGFIAIILRDWGSPVEIRGRVIDIFRRYSTVQGYQPYDLIKELEIRNLFQKYGGKEIKPIPWNPTLEDWIESRHAQCSFSRDRMGKEKADAFDDELRELLSRYCKNGRLELEAETSIFWGRPL